MFVSTSADLRTLVRGNPNGTTFLLASGIHRNKVRVVPKTGQKFVGQDGAILDGGGTGSTLFSGGGDNVEIRNLEIRNYNPGPFNSPISARNVQTYRTDANLNDGSNWIVADNEIHNNNGAGINAGNGMRIVRNIIRDNDQIGISGLGSELNPIFDLEILDNQITGNSSLNPSFAFAFHEGGIKLTFAERIDVRRNNISNNSGAGMYCDLFCDEVDIIGNTFDNNFGRLNAGGVFYELGTNANISNNTIRGVGNFRLEPTPLWGGVTIAESQNVLVEKNLIEMNGAQGIMFRNLTRIVRNGEVDVRAPLSNVIFRQNVVVATSSARETRVGFCCDTALAPGAVQMIGNVYEERSGGKIRFNYFGATGGATQDWRTEWQGGESHPAFDTAGSYGPSPQPRPSGVGAP